MSIRTTVTFDDDVIARLKLESQSRGSSFRDTINELLRTALLTAGTKPSARTLTIRPVRMGYRAGLNYDSVESLVEYGEGDRHG